MLLFIHAGATLYMTGLIWFVQVVHYPLMAKVGSQEASAYAVKHQQLTTWVVAPPMLIEAATAIALLALRPNELPIVAAWTGAALWAVTWLSTALLQVPEHRLLTKGFDSNAHRRLVMMNWIRTAAWSLRGVLSLWMLTFTTP